MCNINLLLPFISALSTTKIHITTTTDKIQKNNNRHSIKNQQKLKKKSSDNDACGAEDIEKNIYSDYFEKDKLNTDVTARNGVRESVEFNTI